MGISTSYFKKQTIDYIKTRFSTDISILDIGAGCGTYFDMLSKEGFTKIDAVEVFLPYIKKFNLINKYRKVYIGDVNNIQIDFEQYDLIILGDVLEHIHLSEAIALINKLKAINLIIAVPFMSEQDALNDNQHEIHRQPDITLQSFIKFYPGLFPLCLRFDYAVFVNDPNHNLIYIENREKDLPSDYRSFVSSAYREKILVNIDLPETTTLVTGLWDIERGSLPGIWTRKFDSYLERFRDLLSTDCNMVVFGDELLQDFVFKYRTLTNTLFIQRDKNWFTKQLFYPTIQKIRNSQEWRLQNDWLMSSPQGALDLYNPIVFSKVELLHEATKLNHFLSNNFYWIDAGIRIDSNLINEKNISKLITIRNLLFCKYNYDGKKDIHGFDYNKLVELAGQQVKSVYRATFFGGFKSNIDYFRILYDNLLTQTLSEGYMGTEESIFTILGHKHPDLIQSYDLESNGYLESFFQNLYDSNDAKTILKHA